jgi:hypothetical protein
VPLSVVLPASIVRAVKIRAAESGHTVRAIVLGALKADGIQVSASPTGGRTGGVGRGPGPRRIFASTPVQTGAGGYDAEMRFPKPPGMSNLRRQLDGDGDAESFRDAVRKQRPCLKCRLLFVSEWAGERICERCKRLQAWREGGGWQSDDGLI